MKGEIINIGTELLLGNIVNTNATYLSNKLADRGIDIYYHTVVGDNKNRLKEVFNIALSRSEVIICTGGLGPTDDDITKETICEALNKKLILNMEELDKIKEYFNKKGLKMTKNNTKQAYVIEGSKVLPNDIGTAPGLYIDNGKNKIVILPGPPKELNIMFEKYVLPLFEQKEIIKSRFIKTIGIGESTLETKIKDIIEKQTNPTIATYAKPGSVDIRVTAKAHSKEKADLLIDGMISKLKPIIDNYVYSYDGKSIEEVVFHLLSKKNMKIGFCESCTGGLICSTLTKIPGASRVFERGIVTYSNQSKIDELNVKKSTLLKYGAVSKETAMEMAKGLLEKGNIDIAISVTGIAGPTGGSKEKPVGLVYIGVSYKDYCYANKFIFRGDRESIQLRACLAAFNEARKALLL